MLRVVTSALCKNAAGKPTQAELARELNISRPGVSRCFKAWRQGAQAHGFATAL